MTTASLQFLCGILRLHSAGGVPWEWSGVVAADLRQPGTAIIMAALTAPPLSARPELARVLRAAGFTQVCWLRMKNDQPRWTPEFPVEKWLR